MTALPVGSNRRPSNLKARPDCRDRRGRNYCRHRLFHRLTCDEYESVWQRGQGCCEICGKPEAEERTGVLCIDHDPKISPAAVRGLLCDRCNTALDQPWIRGPRRNAYLANPWHSRVALIAKCATTPTQGSLATSGTPLTASECDEWLTELNRRTKPTTLALSPWLNSEIERVIGERPLRHYGDHREIKPLLWRARTALMAVAVARANRED